jgi:hypothetical protein
MSQKRAARLDKAPGLDLESPETWAFESAVRRAGNKAARAVVSVAFPREDFELVSRVAEQQGQKTSEFIRGAAIEKATQPARAHMILFGLTGSFSFAPFGSVSRPISVVWGKAWTESGTKEQAAAY